MSGKEFHLFIRTLCWNQLFSTIKHCNSNSNGDMQKDEVENVSIKLSAWESIVKFSLSCSNFHSNKVESRCNCLASGGAIAEYSWVSQQPCTYPLNWDCIFTKVGWQFNLRRHWGFLWSHTLCWPWWDFLLLYVWFF